MCVVGVGVGVGGGGGGLWRSAGAEGLSDRAEAVVALGRVARCTGRGAGGFLRGGRVGRGEGGEVVGEEIVRLAGLSEFLGRAFRGEGAGGWGLRGGF